LSSRATNGCALLALLAAACSGSEPGAPQPLAVTPRAGVNDRVTSVVIGGRGFQILIQANFNDKEQARLATTFVARLGTTSLLDVKLQRDTELRASVPAGLAPGTYDLTVVDPAGKSGALPSAFTVTAPRADAGPDAGLDAGFDADLAHDAGRETSVDQRADSGRDLAVDKSADSKPAVDSTIGPIVSTLAGAGTQGAANGPAATAQFFSPAGIAVSGTTVYVGDYGNHRVRSISGGTAATAAGSGQGFKDGVVTLAQLNFPSGITIDSTGAIYVADTSNDRIRKIAAGSVTTVAGSGTKGFADGAASGAQFNYPRDVAIVGTTIYVADTENHRIRTIAGGTVGTLAGSAAGLVNGPLASARFSSPSSIVALGAKLYVADSGNNCVRVIEAGNVTTLAGSGAAGATNGPAATATFWNPTDIAVSGGKVYVADQSNHRIRVIEAGVVTTLSGSFLGYKDGPVATALFYYPYGLALGPAGELYVADQSNHRIRVIVFK
jgi:serine/threonine protein kinase, bacterial